MSKIHIIIFIFFFSSCSLFADSSEIKKPINIVESSIKYLNGDANNRAVHYVWVDSLGGSPEVYYCRRGFNSKDDSSIIRLSKNSKEAVSPVIKVEGNEVYVVWGNIKQGVLFTKSCDSGETWSAPQEILKTSLSSEIHYTIKMVVMKKRIVVFLEPHYRPIDIVVSLDGGITWKELESPTSYAGQMIGDVDSEVTIHLFFSPYGNKMRYINKNLKTGQWSDEQPIEYMANPMLVIDGRDIMHLVYQKDGCIVYRKSTNKGFVWSDEVCISRNIDIFSMPQITVMENGDVGISWEHLLSEKKEYRAGRRTGIAVPYNNVQVLFTSIRNNKALVTEKPVSEMWREQNHHAEHSLFSGTGQFYICSGQDVFRSYNSGKSWKKLPFLGQRFEFGDIEIYALSLDGTKLKNLTNNDMNEQDINFNPKTNTIAFVSEKKGDNVLPTISKIGILKDGIIQYISGFEPFMGRGGIQFQEKMPHWSPDGKKLAFWIESYDPWLPTGLFVLNVEQNQRKHLCGPSALQYQRFEESYYLPQFEWTTDSQNIMIKKYIIKREKYTSNHEPMQVKFNINTGEEIPCNGKEIPGRIESATDTEVSAYITNKNRTWDYAIYVDKRNKESRITPIEHPFPSLLMPSYNCQSLPVVNNNIIFCMYEIPSHVAERFGIILWETKH